MSRDEPTRVESSRRDVVKYAGTLLGATAIAGCLGDSEENSDGQSASNSTPEQTDTPGSAPTETPEQSTATTQQYSVTMEPMGTVTFDETPAQWVPYGGDYADMGVALGHGDGIVGMGQPGEYYTSPYEELPGVDVDKSSFGDNDLVKAGMAKGLFFEMDADVHVMDTGMLRNWFDWDDGDIEDVGDNVAPFVGNMGFRRSDGWHEYRYYTLYQAFEKMANLFQERERFEAFTQLHDEFIADIQSRLPPAAERPNVFLTYEGTSEPETFSPYRLIDKGTSKKQWNDLGVSDALSGTGIENLSTENRSELDYENLLEVDPDVLLVRGHEDKSAGEFRDVVLGYMREHPVGSQLTAVQNERVYRGGYLRQGPIHNLFLTERAAQQLYPDTFGKVTSDTELFDRQRVADIVTGDF